MPISTLVATLVLLAVPRYQTPVLRLSSQLPQVRLERSLTVPGEPIEAFEVIQALVNERIRHINHLGDLRGLVRIRTCTQALEFVRLRTSPLTYTMWNGDPRNVKQVEIIRFIDYPKMPRFGDLKSSILGPRGEKDSGLSAVLTDAAFRMGGFRRPRVEKVRGGFRVTRWLFLDPDDKPGFIERVSEFVGSDGSYSVRVLQQRRAPALPGTRWGLMRFE